MLTSTLINNVLENNSKLCQGKSPKYFPCFKIHTTQNSTYKMKHEIKYLYAEKQQLNTVYCSYVLTVF
jgi:hypothetical protein